MKPDANSIRLLKQKTPISVLTAYTYPIAQLLEKAGISILLVGDSVGMVEMGFKSTQAVTMEHIEYHTGAVRRGAPNTHIIGDMPFGSDSTSELALQNALLLLEAGADSVKLEGPQYETIKTLVANGIDVVGHTGLTPQTATSFKQVGKDEKDAARILDEASKLEEAGCFLLVLEHIPSELAKRITAEVEIPTIGIGAGKHCDGQVLVTNDALGLGDYWPPFSKQFARLDQVIDKAIRQYIHDVESGEFP